MVAAILGSAVNDSGAIVGGVTLFVLVLGLGGWRSTPSPAGPTAPSPAVAAGEPAGAEQVGDGRQRGRVHRRRDDPGAGSERGRGPNPS